MSAIHIPSTTDSVLIMAEIADCTPQTIFNYWTQPDLLCTWWPSEAETDPRLNGAYHLAWPKMNWHLHGYYTAFEPGEKLAFTWRWEHYPVTSEVIVTFAPLESGGTRMFITHGPYTNTEQGREDRQGHLDGWLHFVAQLQEQVQAKLAIAEEKKLPDV